MHSRPHAQSCLRTALPHSHAAIVYMEADAARTLLACAAHQPAHCRPRCPPAGLSNGQRLQEPWGAGTWEPIAHTPRCSSPAAPPAQHRKGADQPSTRTHAVSIWLGCPLVQDSQFSSWRAASKAASVLQACKGSALMPALVKSCLMQTGAKSAGQARSCLDVRHHLCMLAKNAPSLLQACWVHVRWDVELEPQPDTFDRKTEKCSGHVRPVDAHGRLASSLQAYRAVAAHPATLVCSPHPSSRAEGGHPVCSMVQQMTQALPGGRQRTRHAAQERKRSLQSMLAQFRWGSSAWPPQCRQGAAAGWACPGSSPASACWFRPCTAAGLRAVEWGEVQDEQKLTGAASSH